jgi:hypothetical protein
MSEPLRVEYSREEIIRKAHLWMIAEYGSPKGKGDEERAHFHERVGLLICFLSDAFPSHTEGSP